MSEIESLSHFVTSSIPVEQSRVPLQTHLRLVPDLEPAETQTPEFVCTNVKDVAIYAIRASENDSRVFYGRLGRNARNMDSQLGIHRSF